MKHAVSIDATDNLGDDVDYAPFQVAVNGKTFKVMLDDLYSNKIRGVIRELASNAVDAQIEAATAEQPFDIFLPTTLYPEFRIRDYGTGLSHEDVMNLYVTLFESSKDTNNDVTGAFGLGSKIPFAYTDAFLVTSYFNGEKRVYTANMGSDGTPGMRHIRDLREATDEPNGLEVSISVRSEDFTKFSDELAHLVLAFPQLPNVTSGNFIPLEPIWKSNDGSIFAIGRDYYGTQYAIKQGCAIYPVSTYIYDAGLRDDYTHTIVVDVPIGTVDVAPDREKLSMTPATEKVVKDACVQAAETVRSEVISNLDGARNRREVRRLYTGFAKYALNGQKYSLTSHSAPGENWRPYTIIEVEGGSDWEPLRGRESRKRAVETLSRFSTNTTNNRFVIFRSDAPVKRQALRYSAFVEIEEANGNQVFRLDDPTPRQLSRLVHHLELNKDQIISVATLDDPGPPERKPRDERFVVGVRSHQYEYSSYREPEGHIEEIPSEYYWYKLNRWSNREERAAYDRTIDNARHGNLLKDEIPVLVFTKSAVDKYDPPADKRVDVAIEAAKEAVADEKYLEVVSDLLLAELRSPEIWEALGYEGLEAPRKYRGFSLSASEQERAEKEAWKIIAEQSELYPLLFRVKQFEDAVWYIDSRNNEKELNS